MALSSRGLLLRVVVAAAVAFDWAALGSPAPTPAPVPVSAQQSELGATPAPLSPALCAARVRHLEALVAKLELELQAASQERLEAPGTKAFYRHAFLAFVCVAMAALAAGLTMGLVSIEPMEMKIIVNTEDKDMPAEQDKLKLKEDQEAARKVLPLIQDHHRLLVTLLLMNSLANEALPLFLDKIVPSWLAVILSVTLVLMFGEIIPSAIFTGSDQLKIAASFAPVVSFFKMLLTPVALPIARALDFLLGEDHKGRYNFAELRAIVGIHANLLNDESAHMATFKAHDDKNMGIITTTAPHNFNDETVVIFTDAPGHPAKSTKLEAKNAFYYVSPCDPLVGRDPSCTFRLYSSVDRHPEDLITFNAGELSSGAFLAQERDEIKIMHGVMNLTHMTAADGLTPLSRVHMLERSATFTRASMAKILELGHSRLPVYSGSLHNVRGFILVKTLIVVSPDEGRKVEDIETQQLVLVTPHIPMLDLLNKFQASRCHMALVCSAPEAVRKAWESGSVVPPDVHMMGIITLEDVIEKLIQEDIYDEQDSDMKSRHSLSPSSPWMTASPSRKPGRSLTHHPGSKKEGLKAAARSRASSDTLAEPLLNSCRGEP
mmetsp:Transcript_96095/g.277529  ORF Transcript_96095/g.277529 Transcript_96095/m.277529 type:complete len:604 (-) Transcript_96095:119-1930(-)